MLKHMELRYTMPEELLNHQVSIADEGLFDDMKSPSSSSKDDLTFF
jgi:hypothetical protein